MPGRTFQGQGTVSVKALRQKPDQYIHEQKGSVDPGRALAFTLTEKNDGGFQVQHWSDLTF